MLQLVKAWGLAAELVCQSDGQEPMSIVHEMFRQFERLQGGNMVRNLSGLATRRRVLKQSFSRIAAFDKIQEMNGDPKFTELPLAARQNVMRTWKNSNLLDLSAELYEELGKVIALDTRAVSLEDMRRAKVGSAKAANASGARASHKSSRPAKKQRVDNLQQESKEGDEDSGCVVSSQPTSVIDDSEEEKFAIPMMVVQSRIGANQQQKSPVQAPTTNSISQTPPAPTRMEAPRLSVADNASSAMVSKSNGNEMYCSTQVATEATQTSNPAPLSLPAQVPAAPRSLPSGIPKEASTRKVVVAANDNRGAQKTTPSVDSQAPVTDMNLAPKPTVKPTQTVSVDTRIASKESQKEAKESKRDTPSVTAASTGNLKSPGRWGKRKRKVHADGPNGHLWETNELDILIKAWEKAAILVCNSDPAERLSLNREMYREFLAMQGGSSVRNSTALAARRSSLKFSYEHIRSFNESQKAKGEPSYHEIPEDKRMTLLRSWKNRNSVDLTKGMYDGLGRILAMDEKLAEVRSLRPPPLPQKAKTKSKSSKGPKESSDFNHSSKTAKWSTDESSDLIKACADVMNVPANKTQSATERESLIYDAFVVRRKNAGDTDTPIRRDLRSMAQQWRYILASYAYIKACNENRAEADSPTWFTMSPMQKRAYQQCTNVPLKFVDLSAEMFELVTETSFEGVVPPASTLPAPVTNSSSEGVSLRPRSTRKRTEAFYSSDSETSVMSISTTGANRSAKDPTATVAKKGNNWPEEELWNLIKAWEDASTSTKSGKLTSALNATFTEFSKLQEGSSNRNRTINSVRNKMIALKSSFTSISAFMAERGDSMAWFAMTPDQRLSEIRGWKNKTIMDLSKDMFDALAQILHKKTSQAYEGNGKRKPGRPPARAETKIQDEKGHAGQKPEKYVAANWSKEELLMLGEACGELLEGRRTRRYVFEEEKDRFFRRYEELGGTNSLAAAVGLARFMMDSYEFIYFYNEKAAETNSLSWFELDSTDRDSIVTRMSRAYRSFNGLNTVDEDIFNVIDGIDAELRLKLREKKKKTYKPPNDATSSRYVDIEAVVQRCIFKKRTHPAPKKSVAREVPVQLQELSSNADADSSSSESLSAEEATATDSSAAVTSSIVPRSLAQERQIDGTTPRHAVIRRHADSIRRGMSTSRKRVRDADGDVESSTLYITEIIQEQNRKLEAAVKRFRKDSSDARKEHHAFLLQKIQDSFPVDTGNGSFLERVAERQGQTLVDIFQRLQKQREVEKAKDDELMRQLFGRTGQA
ncbi:unnamed protein product [Phytophthora lilii]|uniref:Unnamed protein product n=1 Tax=Phytophthora lilii TaxID=2077276 RepID=A0A9W6TEI2_9STRA|nr:unnamed protein product [Phytophthora lilii]